MTGRRVADAYDAVAQVYTELFLHQLTDDGDAQPWLERFVDVIDPTAGLVVDAGCGPGAAVDLLAGRGLRAVGIDLSPGLLAQARAAFPDRDFRLGDITALDVPDGSLAGILSRYSIIHLSPEELVDVFARWQRALAPGAPLLLFFFASHQGDHHGRAFDHKVTTAYELFPETIADHLERAGFVDIRSGASPPTAGGRPLDKGVVLARRAPG